jgi:hypothetical protein
MSKNILNGSESAPEIMEFADRLHQPYTIDVYNITQKQEITEMDFGGAIVYLAILRSGSMFPLKEAHIH